MAEMYIARQWAASTTPTIMETKDHIIIEGQVCDKVTLNPVMLMRYEQDVSQGSVQMILMNRYWINLTSSDATNRPDCDYGSVKQDGGAGWAKLIWDSNFNDDEFYVTANYANRYVSRVKRSNYWRVQNGCSSTDPWNMCSIFDEWENNIWLMWRHGTLQGGYYEAGYSANSVDKRTWSWSNGTMFYYGAQMQLVHKAANFFYHSYNGGQAQHFGRHLLYAWDRQGGVTNTNVLDLNGATYYCIPTPSFARSKPNATGVYFYYIALTNGSAFTFKRVEINEATPTAAPTVYTVSVDYAGSGYSAVDLVGISASSKTVQYQSFTVRGATKDYYGLAVNERTVGSSQAISIFNTYIFEIDHANPSVMKLKQKISSKLKPRQWFPIDTEFKKVIQVFDTCLSFYSFDEVAGSYTHCNDYTVNVHSFGIDELDRIWVRDTGGVIHLTTAFIPAKVTVKYEKSTYEYTGQPFESWIEVGAYDAFGNRIASSVSLTLDSRSTKFTDNTSIRQITTSQYGDVRIPISVDGAGYIKVVASIGV